MATLNAFYVRKVTDDTVDAIRGKFPSTEIKRTSEYTGILLGNYAKTPEQDLMELSSLLETDVIWLSFQSVVDAFEYYHWNRGSLLRALVYGCYSEERTWERIEGEAEAWEQAAFFNPEFLASILEDEEESDAEKQRLEQFWQAGKLILGRMEPYLNARECARHVVNYYLFPRLEA